MARSTLAGRRALVTGAAGGIGAAVARGLLDEGAQVMISDVDAGRGERTAHELSGSDGPGCVFQRADVSSEEEVTALVARAERELGGLDILVNNAGVAESGGGVTGVPVAEWRRVMDVNVTGTFLCSRAAFPLLARGGHGAVVNLSSIFGVTGLPAFPAYSASKGAISNLTRQLAVEGGPMGIRVNAVLPGYVDNDMGDSRSLLSPGDAAEALRQREAAAARQPIARQCSTGEIAAVVTFLVSPAASFVTGVLMPVDGGFLAQGDWRGPEAS
ncbi:SDR family NAD(P)-dependent oxidoreductase [Microbispora amethystogenes]|uniref:Oxidoreductase n=1 Tax=Microbispora amethystogenes TaxID=1427754 RepID=A0ABQ4FB02_9ACTN|nr:SDR family oxidoreductase [Microbispora amethystogenes]GIH31958.1 oxidoreductase [Microbispora amethystogenes]